MKKNILILGGKSKVGIAIAKQFASKGYNILSAGRQINTLNNLKDNISEKYNIEFQLIEFDILEYEKFNSFIKSLSLRPCAIICVIGKLDKVDSSVSQVLEKNIVLQTNYVGPALLLDMFAEEFSKEQENLSIIGISSVAGERGRASNYFYGSAKSGFTQYLSGLRQKYNLTNINVITIKPGFIDTEMIADLTPPKFLVTEPDELARMIYIAYKKNKLIVYTRYWKYIMLLIKIIPESIFKKFNF